MTVYLDNIREQIENEWLNLGDTSLIQTISPFENRSDYDRENPEEFILRLMRDPRYFYFTCKHVLNLTLHPFQLAILRELWKRPFPILLGTRGFSKSFILAVYFILRGLFCQGIKMVVVGSVFRQSKIVFEYAEKIWYEAPVLRDLCGSNSRNGPHKLPEKWTLNLGDSSIIALPMGDGRTIRGHRANIIAAEEFASMNPDVFENVISAFSSVSMSPVEKVREMARRRAMERLGLADPDEVPPNVPGLNSNQSILVGTAFYAFNHFNRYWKKWKGIIQSKGDPDKLAEALGGPPGKNLNWQDYCVIRVPVDLLPEGFMDPSTIAKQKASLHSWQYMMEYGACFPNDSNGFFRRSLIESCCCDKNVISHPSCEEINFTAVLRGDPSRCYVMAIDTASEVDNFAVVILEVWPDHRRIVLCWTTNKKGFTEKQRRGLVREKGFYAYSARKIRDLMTVFNVRQIAMDSQGGGNAVLEAMNADGVIAEGEPFIWPTIDREKPKPTDDKAGLHIAEMVNFARYEYTREANHSLRLDMERKTIIFPEFNTAILGLAGESDKSWGRAVSDSQAESDPDAVTKVYDTLEDCMLEIEELKDELTSITHGQTPNGNRERWDTPETKSEGMAKGRLKKDRYSALLMANMSARNWSEDDSLGEQKWNGGFCANNIQGSGSGKSLTDNLVAPEWYRRALEGRSSFGLTVKR